MSNFITKNRVIEAVCWVIIASMVFTGWNAWRRVTSWSDAQADALAPEVDVAPAINAVSVNASLWPDRPVVVSDPGEPQVIVGPDGVTTFFGTASWYDYSFYWDETYGDVSPDGAPCNRAREDCYTEDKLFAAMRDVPRGRPVTVTNLANGKSVTVRITDYGPDEDLHPGRVIDLTSYAFSRIADIGDGLIEVKVEWGR